MSEDCFALFLAFGLYSGYFRVRTVTGKASQPRAAGQDGADVKMLSSYGPPVSEKSNFLSAYQMFQT
jgi:hypothetical protein